MGIFNVLTKANRNKFRTQKIEWTKNRTGILLRFIVACQQWTPLLLPAGIWEGHQRTSFHTKKRSWPKYLTQFHRNVFSLSHSAIKIVSPLITYVYNVPSYNWIRIRILMNGMNEITFHMGIGEWFFILVLSSERTHTQSRDFFSPCEKFSHRLFF